LSTRETFEPKYEVLEGKEKVVSELKAAAKKGRYHLHRLRPLTARERAIGLARDEPPRRLTRRR